MEISIVQVNIFRSMKIQKKIFQLIVPCHTFPNKDEQSVYIVFSKHFVGAKSSNGI
jgi:hypothetical protein